MFTSTNCNYAVCVALPLAFSVISKWGQYLDAVEKAKMGIKMKVEDFGSLGSSGLAAGAFLTSPFSDGRPDIQLTVFPSNIVSLIYIRSYG